jgi:hypothetical protein
MNQENEFFNKARKIAQSLDSNSYVYTPSSTDITIRWRKLYNYVPASEQACYQKKWKESRYLHSPTFCDNSRILGVCKDLGRGVM